MKLRNILLAGVALVFGVAAIAAIRYWAPPGDGANPVIAATGSGGDVTLMDFSKSFSLNPLPPGWRHRSFWFVPAMELSFTEKDGVAGLRCETNSGASILSRNTNIALTDYPTLAWGWHIEVPIENDIDERTEGGDDHPARLFLRFEDETGKNHPVEIIWSNKLFSPGDYKIIGDFPHYVANGRAENVGVWHSQQVDLLEIYKSISKRSDKPRLKSIGIFCDSDNAGGRSVAYFSDVVLRKRL